MQTPSRNAQNKAMCIARMDQNPAAATIKRPVIMPLYTYPNFVASHPAGSAIKK